VLAVVSEPITVGSTLRSLRTPVRNELRVLG
jgi:hypothetical protein